MRIPWRQIAWTTGISLPLVALGAVVWGSTRDLSRYQAKLTEHVRKVTGRELKAQIPLSIHIGRHPALVAEGVTLTNAPWGARPDLARVRKLTMYLDPIALLVGEVKVSKALLEGADILIERNEAGDTNLEMLPPPDGSGPRPGANQSLRVVANPAFPWIDTVEVRDSLLTVSEGANRPPVVLNVSSATLKSSASNQTMQIDARLAAPKAATFALTGSIGSFEGWIRGVPGNIDLQGGLGEGHVAIKGAINTKGINLQATADGPDFSVLGPYVHLPLPSGGPYALTAKVLTQRNGLKVEVPTLKVGESDATGEALFRVDRQGTPYVTVNIDSNKIDLAGLHAAKTAVANDASAQRFFPTAPFSANWLGRKSLSVTARVGEVSGLSSGKITNGSVTLSSGETRFAFRAAATLGSGAAGFDLVYDPAGRFGSATLTATASHVSFADLGTLLGLDLGLKDAVGDIDLRLRGPGRAAHDVLNIASGTIEFSAAKGVWPRDGLGNWPVETQRLLGATDAGVPFNCLAGSFEVRSGVANLRRLVVDTPRAVLIGGGYLQFRSEGWEFMLAPEARDASGTALAIPLRLKGGTGRPTGGALDPGLSKLLVGGGPVPSLAGTLNTLGRQPNANACALMLPRLDGMRPGLRAQLPTPAVDSRGRPTRKPAQTKRE